MLMTFLGFMTITGLIFNIQKDQEIDHLKEMLELHRQYFEATEEFRLEDMIEKMDSTSGKEKIIDYLIVKKSLNKSLNINN